MNHWMNMVKCQHVSEKSMSACDKGIYVFKVDSRATKKDIEQCIAWMFGVQVLEVRACSVKSKKVQFRGISGERKAWKKAYVRLVPGQTIPFESMMA